MFIELDGIMTNNEGQFFIMIDKIIRFKKYEKQTTVIYLLGPIPFVIVSDSVEEVQLKINRVL